MNRYIQHLPKRFHVLIVVVVLSNVLNGSCLAANLHSILICYTDEMGRPDRDTTYERMAHTVSNIAYYAGLNHQPHHFTEYQFDYSEVVNFLQNFWCEPDATVFVLYDGHGGNVAGSDWPYWVFPTGEELPMDRVINTLRQKNPRLLIVLSGACNSGDGEEIVISPNRGLKSLEPVPPCYRKLFAETRGEVLGTAAPPGEVSWGDIYPHAFLNSLHSVCQGSDSNVTWQEVMKRTSDESIKRTQYFSLGEYEGPQHPVSEINLGSSGDIILEAVNDTTKMPKSSFCTGDLIDVKLINNCGEVMSVSVIDFMNGVRFELYKGFLASGINSLSEVARTKFELGAMIGTDMIWVEDEDGRRLGNPLSFEVQDCSEIPGKLIVPGPPIEDETPRPRKIVPSP